MSPHAICGLGRRQPQGGSPDLGSVPYMSMSPTKALCGGYSTRLDSGRLVDHAGSTKRLELVVPVFAHPRVGQKTTSPFLIARTCFVNEQNK